MSHIDFSNATVQLLQNYYRAVYIIWIPKGYFLLSWRLHSLHIHYIADKYKHISFYLGLPTESPHPFFL